MEVLSTETEQVRESEGLEVRAMSDLAYSETEHRPGFPGGSDSKVSACTAGDLSSIPALGRPLEKEMTTHSSIRAWRVPWTEEPGGLPFMVLQIVRHD